MKKRKAGKIAPIVLFFGMILFFIGLIASQFGMTYLAWFAWCISLSCTIGSVILIIVDVKNDR